MSVAIVGHRLVWYYIPVMNHPLYFIYVIFHVNRQSFIANPRSPKSMDSHSPTRKLLLEPYPSYHRQCSSQTMASDQDGSSWVSGVVRKHFAIDLLFHFRIVLVEVLYYAAALAARIRHSSMIPVCHPIFIRCRSSKSQEDVILIWLVSYIAGGQVNSVIDEANIEKGRQIDG